MFSGAVAQGAAVLAGAFDALKFFQQTNRLLRLETALESCVLVPERASIREAVNQPFEIVIDALSTSAYLDPATLVGEQISLQLQRGDGSYRPWHGYVLQAARLDSDGGAARYRFVTAPWLSFLGLRRDSFVFQDKTALDIVEEVFKDYPQAHYRIEATEALRRRSLCIQYRESDLDFVTRLLAEEGLSYHFEHLAAEGAAQAAEQGHAKHVLVITDRGSERPQLGDIRYTRPDVNTVSDAISTFGSHRRVQPNAVTLGSWNYKQLVGTTAADASSLPQGDVGELEQYDGSGTYRYENAEHAERAAALRLAWHELNLKQFEGQGAMRALEAGRRFFLVDHPLYGANTSAFNYSGQLTASRQRPDNEFTLLSVEHEAANNLGADLARWLNQPELERGGYRNRFTAAPAAAPVVPRFVRKATAPGAQTALVVGASGETITTERDLRVKVQFHWQRGQRPNPGGLAHESAGDKEGNAPGNEQAGTWVRVAMPSAGANHGAVFVPRQGTEVVVEFLDGDIDRPVIVGQVFNGQDLPPYSAGVDSSVNHPGVISGLYTHALDGQGSNSWVVDDATGQLRMRFLCSHAMSELGLGHLIEQSVHSAQRGAWRGSGFELATEGWAMVRATEGLLISTTARPQQGASVASTQMDVAEAVSQLKAAHDLGKRLSDAAEQQQALKLASHDAEEAVERLIRVLDVEQDGKYPGPVNGQEALKAQPGSRELADPVEKFSEPVILMETPSTAAFVTPATHVQFTGEDLSLVTQGDLHQTAGHTYSSVSGETTSLFTHDGGIQVVAANGPVSLRAHTDAMEILADGEITVVSVNDEIRIQAKSKIEMVAGQSRITLEGGDITFACPGAFTVKSSGHQWEGPGQGEAQLPFLPDAKLGESPRFVELNYHYDDLEPIAGAPYKVVFESGAVFNGVLDGKGFARIEGVPPGAYRVEYGEDPREWKPESQESTPEWKDPQVKQEAERLLESAKARRRMNMREGVA
ncbi:type VI secretion system tip protein VgrG [Aquabacterium sp. A7-Y]|uniref:type VI secretion system Vgr family protein n=1 Tax=Aquabacterium sp. A7-Y TaxID=1349605 RepID=UPI00223CBDB4|nr:type VI secretion system Vgr family protein [Aquabacterium sp. A7-Y]MCW7538029.1 type VI secretion system tip protein VgrG [Aquabacterium sp. A7-Y]